ncbi:MAG: CopG family transcriptional regulator [Thermomicrobiales bacterium]|nr:CopG family transcriptional regulator [Thermomicrobiales bacterium]
MEKTTLYLPADLMAAYTALARKRGRPKAELMRDALASYAERQERDLPDWIGMLDVQDAFDSTNVKSWLLENWDPD